METPVPRSVLFDAYTFGFRAFCAHIRLLCLTFICALGGFFILFAGALVASQVYRVPLASGLSLEAARLVLQNVPRGLIVLYGLMMLFYFLYTLAGCIRIALDVCRTGTSNVGRLFAAPLSALMLFAGFMLVAPLLAMGFAAFLVPGLFLTVRFALTPWVIVDQRINPISAIVQSWRLTSGYFWEMAALLYIGVGIEMLQSLPLKAIAYAISSLATAYFYRAMLAKNTQAPYTA
jgi:hypothetical protein